MTWIWSLTPANGSIVGASSKFLPSPFGHHLSKLTPFGMVTNAIRCGTALAASTAAPLAAASAARAHRGNSDGNDGNTTQAPTPRKNRRRLIDHCRSAATSRSRESLFDMATALHSSRHAPRAVTIIYSLTCSLKLSE